MNLSPPDIPQRILQSWLTVDIHTVENHLKKCAKSFKECYACTSIAYRILLRTIYIPLSDEWQYVELKREGR